MRTQSVSNLILTDIAAGGTIEVQYEDLVSLYCVTSASPISGAVNIQHNETEVKDGTYVDFLFDVFAINEGGSLTIFGVDMAVYSGWFSSYPWLVRFILYGNTWHLMGWIGPGN